MSNTQWAEFVAEYPLAANTREAWLEWDQIPPFDRDAVLEGLRTWKRSEDWSDPRFIPNAANFLRRELWKQTPRSLIHERKPFDPEAEEKPLSQEELFRRRHIGTAASYHFYMKAQSPENYIYKRR